MSVYELGWQTKKDLWEDLLYFDLETTDSLELLQSLKEKQQDISYIPTQEDLDLLNAKNSKWVTIGLYSKFEKKADIVFNLVKFSKSKIGNYIFYYNKQPLESKKIATIILQAAVTCKVKGICAFNGYRFDFVIFEEDICKRIMIKNSVYISAGKRQLRLVDIRDITSTYGGTSLEKSCEKLGIDFKKEYKDFLSYRINDVKSLMDIASKFQENQIGYSTTRTSRQNIPIQIKTFVSNKIDLDFIGGRVEIFKHKADKAYIYDANSLYPHVMVNFLYPNTVMGRTSMLKLEQSKIDYLYKSRTMRLMLKEALQKGLDLKEIYEMYFSIFPIINVKLHNISEEFEEYKDIIHKYFPFSYKKDGSRYFRFNKDAVYQVQGYESLFLPMFDFEVVGEAFFCNVSPFPGAEEVRKLIEKRNEMKNSQDPKQYTVKIIANSVFGLLGLRVDSLRMKDKAELSKENLEKKRIFSRISAPLHAIATTSSGRFAMYQVILKLIMKGFEVYYMDTDSIFTNCPPEQFWEISGTKLANAPIKFKLEKEVEDLNIILPKVYYYISEEQTVIKAKGIGNAFERVFTVQTMKTNIRLMRRGLEMTSIPKKIPNEHWESVWNDQSLQLKDTKLAELIPTN